MDVNAIFNGGGTLVRNPRYSKSKKNTEPEFINVVDANLQSSGLASALYDNADLSYTTQHLGNIEKYLKHSIVPGRDSREEELQAELSKAQSNWDKAGNMLAQTLSEATLGTALGFSNIFDFIVGGTMRLATGETNDYSNPVSQFLENLQEQVKEATPIYTDPNVSIDTGGLSNASWWFSNMPSIISSLTLMIPARAATMGIGKLAQLSKATNIGRRASIQSRRWLGKALGGQTNVNRLGTLAQVGFEGNIMRIGENYQEARQTYNELLPQAVEALEAMAPDEYAAWVENRKDILGDIDYNNKQEVAKRVASRAADETFKSDMINGVFDIWQLYALRNLGRIMNAPMRGNLNRLDKLSRKFPGKTKEQLEEMLKSRSFGRKVFDTVKDYTIGSATVAWAEANEAVEEAVNYAAQQEGLTYGQALLQKVSDEQDDAYLARNLKNRFVPFSRITRNAFEEYIKNPDLHDSAFWGLMGGIAFQGLGSAFNRASQYQKARQTRKELRDLGVDEENIPSMTELMEIPELEARRKNIESRHIEFEALKSKLQSIKDGKDPYNTGVALENDQQKDIARRRVIEDYKINLMLGAMDVGNWNITKSFINSDELRQAFVDAGYMTDSEARQEQQETKDLAEKLERLYNQNLQTIDNAISRYADDELDLTDVPVQLFNIVARSNIQHQIAAERLGQNLADTEIEIGEEEERVAKELAKMNTDYKQLAKTRVQAQVLGQLLAEREEILNSKDGTTLLGQSEIKRLDNQIELVKNQLKQNISTDADYARYLDAVRLAYSIRKNKDGEYIVDETKQDFRRIDEAITSGNLKDIVDLDLLTGDETESLTRPFETEEDVVTNHTRLSDVRDAMDILADVYETMYSTDKNRKVSSLADISKLLSDKYHDAAVIEIERLLEENQIALTASQVADAVDRINNNMLSVRGAMLTRAMNGFQQLAKKYGKDEIKTAIELATEGRTNDTIESFDEHEKPLFDDFIKLMNLNKGINAMLRKRVFDALDLNDIYEFSEEEDVFKPKEEQTQTSTINQNPSESTQNVQQGESSSSTSQTSTTQASPQISPQPTPITPQPTPTRGVTNKVRLKLDMDKGLIVTAANDTDSGADIINVEDLGNNRYKLNVTSSNATWILKNKDLFEGDATSNFEINAAPIIVWDGDNVAVESKGVISQISSTGERNQTGLDDGTAAERAAEMESDDLPVEIANAIIEYIRDNETYNYNEVADYLRDKFKDANKDRLESYIKVYVEDHAEIAEMAGRTVEAVPIASIAMFSTLNDLNLPETSKQKVNSILENAFKQILDDYAKHAAIEQVNGKLQLRLENLLRYVNSVTDNKAQAEQMYETFKELIAKSDKYVLLDGNTPTATVINNSRKSYKERREELRESSTATSINVNGYVARLNRRLRETKDKVEKDRLAEAIEFIYEELDKANPGQRITYKRQEGNNQRGIDFFINGIKIAEIPLPNNTSTHYIMDNDGWVTDVPKSTGTSEFANFVKYVLVPQAGQNTTLHDLFVAWMEKPDDDTVKAFFDEFEKHDEFKSLKSTRRKDSTRLNGLKKIYDYLKQIGDIYSLSDAFAEELKDIRDTNMLESIDDWFDKLKISYENAIELGTNPDLDIVIQSINEGNAIKTNTKNQLPVSKAIGEEQKETAAIGITTSQGVITVSDGTTVNGSAKRGIPFLILKGRHNKVADINITSQRLNSDNFKNNDEIKAIVNEVINTFKNRLTSWGDIANATDSERADLLDFFRTLVDRNYGASTPLFQGIQVEPLTGNFDGFQLTYRDNKGTHYIKFYNNMNGSRRANIEFDNDRQYIIMTPNALNKTAQTNAINRLANILKENLYFNIANEYVISDAAQDTILYGFATRKDGKFVINIDGEHEHVFESFNRFILDNDAINAATRPYNGRNFYRPGEDGSMDRTTLTYSISQASSPVEEIVDNAQTESEAVKKGDEAIAQLSKAKKGTNRSKLILKGLLKGTQLNLLNNSRLIQNLLHKNVIYIEDYNELSYVNSKGETVKIPDSVKASYSRTEREYTRPDGTKITIPADTIVISKVWVDLANGNLSQQEQAARDIIHENVHRLLTLDENKDWQTKAQQIFDAFMTAELTDANDIAIREAYTKNGLEEFLVESLTRPQLMNVLNKIQAGIETIGKNVKIKKTGTLLQRIIKFVSELFGVNINENSLLEKEYNLFGNIVQQEEVKQQIQEEQQRVDLTQVDEITNDDNAEEIDIDFSQLNDVTVASTQSLANRLIPEVKEKFNSMINNGLIEITCK